MYYIHYFNIYSLLCIIFIILIFILYYVLYSLFRLIISSFLDSTCFFQDHLYISSINFSRILITLYRNGIFLNKAIKIQKLIFLFSFDYFYFYYIIPPVKSSYPLSTYYPLIRFVGSVVQKEYVICFLRPQI